MEAYRHYVSGFFSQRKDADASLSLLVSRGLPSERLHIFSTGRGSVPAKPESDSDNVLKDMLTTGAIGSAVGTGMGALAEVGLVMANVSLFVASPLIAPLMLLGWGATLGGLMGATVGAAQHTQHKDGWFSALIRDAISNGHVVLVADTWSPQETEIAQAVLHSAIGGARDSPHMQ